MELPQARPRAGRQPTHDFLSLYSHSTAQQDPRPPSQGNYLKTHDFLQPLERVVKTTTPAKEEAADEISTVVQKPPPPPAMAPISCVEHVLPGGIGTYSISHNSFSNNQRAPKPEAISILTQPQLTSIDRNDEHSNCTSYTGGSSFTLWEDSAANKLGKTGKENFVDKPLSAGSAARVGQWALSERTPQSFSYNRHNSFKFNSLSSSSQSQTNVRKSQSFMEMIKSAKDCSQDDDFDNEETSVLKKEPSKTPPPGDLRVKEDGKSPDQKPSTPRSKHSATEQRRRSKINDRFQMLRELIPHGDQKRDKASFLLEVIEYIHFLQEKVDKYEGSYQGWNQEPEKLMPWRNNQRPEESYADQSRDTNSGAAASPSPKLLFASKIDEKIIAISPAIPGSSQNMESGMSTATATATTFKPMDHHSGLTNKAMPSPIPWQENFCTPAQSGGVASQLTHRLLSDAENNTHQPSVQCQTYSYASDKLKEKDLTIEVGAISISSVYSKGLLDTLTQALQSSGVDLSQARISVQIELGKQGNIGPATATPAAKDDEILSSKQGPGVIRPRISGVEDSDKAVKKIKTCRKA